MARMTNGEGWNQRAFQPPRRRILTTVQEPNARIGCGMLPSKRRAGTARPQAPELGSTRRSFVSSPVEDRPGEMASRNRRFSRLAL